VKICFLSQQWPPDIWNGLGTYTHNTARALAAAGHEVHVLACAPGRAVSDQLVEGVHVHWRPTMLPATRRLRRAPVVGLAWRALERVARGRNYPDDRLLVRLDLAVSDRLWYRRLGLRVDVVEAQESDGHALLFTVGRHRPALVVHLHGPAMLRARLWGRLRLRGRVADAIDRASARRADVVSTSSALMLRTLREVGWIPADREVLVIPNTYGGPIPPVTQERTPPTVLAVGRIEPTKSPEDLVRAAALLRDRVPGCTVQFVGGHPGSQVGRRFAAGVEALARRLDAPCVFHGSLPRERVLALYRSARVVAVPSRLDNFPSVVLEALAHGRPVVCSEGVGSAELVVAAGAGTVVPVGDPEALARALAAYLVDEALAREAGRRGRELLVTRLSPEAVVRAREEAYREAVQRRTGRRQGVRVMETTSSDGG
jgi:glycogen(starch) synthase